VRHVNEQTIQADFIAVPRRHAVRLYPTTRISR